jgi:hypothetical protein
MTNQIIAKANNLALRDMGLSQRQINTGVWLFLGVFVVGYFAYAAFCTSRGMRFNGGVTWNNGFWVRCD